MRQPGVQFTTRQLNRALSIIVLTLMFLPGQASARMEDVSLKELVSGSNLIVLAKVTKIEEGPADLEGFDGLVSRPKFATAQVIETWKGQAAGEVRYLASPTWTCDISDAEVGETVVLFLTKRVDSSFLEIVFAGRGRMPVRKVMAKSYAELSSNVILPKRLPTISQESPPSGPLNHTYTVESIDLMLLKKLARQERSPQKMSASR